MSKQSFGLAPRNAHAFNSARNVDMDELFVNLHIGHCAVGIAAAIELQFEQRLPSAERQEKQISCKIALRHR